MIRTDNRKYFWDESNIDVENTTAAKIIHSPIKKEKVITFDKPWEGDSCCYFDIVKDPTGYKMYYDAHEAINPTEYSKKITICMLESKDGLKWERAKINRIAVEDITENNIVKDSSEFSLDNFTVFYDENPNCPDSERYKATAMVLNAKEGYVELYAYYSPDGKEFKRSHSMFGKCCYKDKYRDSILFFDSMNVAFWDKEKGKYLLFLRGFHNIPFTERSIEKPGNDIDRNEGIRDIRYSESLDFIHWSEPELLKFEEKDCPLYTNCTYKYSPDMYVAFPTRYIEHKEWSDSFEELCSKEGRRYIVDNRHDKREGLAVTDALFMCSSDGKNWCKTSEAFITPGPEFLGNWAYGNCYPAVGLIATPSIEDEGQEVLSMYMTNKRRFGYIPDLCRYEIRKDGFISRYGDGNGKILTTKEFTWTGDKLSVNFATSAAGGITVKMICEDGTEAVSQEHFGDSTDRIVAFDKNLSEFKGKKVKLEITLKEAHIYSFAAL